jgi:hypothetical protein
LITQPAERISTVPRMNIHTTSQSGFPSADSQSPHSVGQRSRRMPIGLSSRISRS